MGSERAGAAVKRPSLFSFSLLARNSDMAYNGRGESASRKEDAKGELILWISFISEG